MYRRVLINDIVARPDECAALVKAYEARAVCVANTFQCKLAHKKAFFAVLTDDRNAALFSDRRARRHPRARAVDAASLDAIRTDDQERPPFRVAPAGARTSVSSSS